MQNIQKSSAESRDDERDCPAGELIINGTRYANTKHVAALFGISERTVSRWIALRIAPPRIKIGKLILFNLDRLPEWLARHEQEPLRPAVIGRGRRAG